MTGWQDHGSWYVRIASDWQGGNYVDVSHVVSFQYRSLNLSLFSKSVWGDTDPGHGAIVCRDMSLYPSGWVAVGCYVWAAWQPTGSTPDQWWWWGGMIDSVSAPELIDGAYEYTVGIEDVTARLSLVSAAFPAQTVHDRLVAVAQAAQLGFLTDDIDNDLTPLPATDTPVTLMVALQDAALDGVSWVDALAPAGVPRAALHYRQWSHLPVSTLTIPLDQRVQGSTVVEGIDQMCNSLLVDWTGGTNTYPVDASIQQYGQRQQHVATHLATQEQVTLLAGAFLNTYAWPVERLDGLWCQSGKRSLGPLWDPTWMRIPPDAQLDTVRPNSAPDAYRVTSEQGFVTAGSWSVVWTVAPFITLGLPQAWQDVDPATVWSAVPPSITWDSWDSQTPLREVDHAVAA